jgi:hypothetical protein
MILLDASHISHIILLGICPFLPIQRVPLLEAKCLEYKKREQYMLKTEISIISDIISHEYINSGKRVKCHESTKWKPVMRPDTESVQCSSALTTHFSMVDFKIIQILIFSPQNNNPG